ncbi:DNA cytosine methyltransferase, partial [Blautia wexlerae]
MLKTIDLFAGAGGLSYGFESTGEFLIVAAAENNKNARKTYIENHKGRNDIRMITDVRGYDFSALASEFDGIDVVIGGPPCQGFSNANRQKNHIISMNNSLVKEYFRAIREIRPKAFVMENVSMLSSETHRFYDSTKDHNVVTELGVQMREDELVLSDSDYHGYSLMNIIEADEIADYKISDELFQLLNVLYKNRNNEERLRKYIDNKSKLIIDKIASQTEEVKNNLGFLGQISNLINTEQIRNCFSELGQFIKFQKTFRLKEELDSNEIIYEIKYDPETGKIIAQVKSYSVIEYVNKILGDDYKKNNEVVNS